MNENVIIVLAAVLGLIVRWGIPSILWPVKPRTQLTSMLLPPRLTESDVEETMRAAYKELGLGAYEAAKRSIANDPGRVIGTNTPEGIAHAMGYDLRPPEYFAISQDIITDPATGDRLAIVRWRSPTGKEHAYSERVPMLPARAQQFRYDWWG